VALWLGLEALWLCLRFKGESSSIWKCWNIKLKTLTTNTFYLFLLLYRSNPNPKQLLSAKSDSRLKGKRLLVCLSNSLDVSVFVAPPGEGLIYHERYLDFDSWYFMQCTNCASFMLGLLAIAKRSHFRHGNLEMSIWLDGSIFELSREIVVLAAPLSLSETVQWVPNLCKYACVHCDMISSSFEMLLFDGVEGTMSLKWFGMFVYLLESDKWLQTDSHNGWLYTRKYGWIVWGSPGCPKLSGPTAWTALHMWPHMIHVLQKKQQEHFIQLILLPRNIISPLRLTW
jgi:hypothetical protein